MVSSAAKTKKTQQERAKARKEKKEKDTEDELPEVDQDTKLRQRVKWGLLFYWSAM